MSILEHCEGTDQCRSRRNPLQHQWQGRKLPFQPKIEQCSIIKIKDGPNPHGIKEVIVTPRKKDNLVALVKEIMREGKNEEEGMLGLETQTPTSQQDQPSTSRTKKARKQVQQSVSASLRMHAPAYCNAREKSCTWNIKRRALAKGKLYLSYICFFHFDFFLVFHLFWFFPLHVLSTKYFPAC